MKSLGVLLKTPKKQTPPSLDRTLLNLDRRIINVVWFDQYVKMFIEISGKCAIQYLIYLFTWNTGTA